MSTHGSKILSVIVIWGIAASVFVFGFLSIRWTGWAGGVPWMFGVTSLFCSAAYTSKWLMTKGEYSKK